MLTFSRSLCLVGAITAFLIAGGCTRSPAIGDIEAYTQEIEQWRKLRLSRLMRDDGWLTLCGLFWLREGENRCGTDPSLPIVFPEGKAPALLGTFTLRDGRVSFTTTGDANVLHDSIAVTTIELLSDDDDGGPTILKYQTLSFYVIKRGTALAVRVKDSQNPVLLEFKGLDYFPINPRYRLRATFVPYNPPRRLDIVNMWGMEEPYESPGALEFEMDGRIHQIDAVREGDALFVMFKDLTNGNETYEAGRQLYPPLPDSNNVVILDFNKAYNWPCVFTDFATCPLPPQQNQLPIRIEAGEKMYAGYVPH